MWFQGCLHPGSSGRIYKLWTVEGHPWEYERQTDGISRCQHTPFTTGFPTTAPIYVSLLGSPFETGISTTRGWAPREAQWERTHLPMQETWVQSLGWEDLLEKGTATHSSILAWRISRTEEPGRLQSVGLQELDMTEGLNNHHHT